VGGDHGDRQVYPRHLEAVLHGELVGAVGALGGELPVAAPQLDVRQGEQGLRSRELLVGLA